MSGSDWLAEIQARVGAVFARELARAEDDIEPSDYIAWFERLRDEILGTIAGDSPDEDARPRVFLQYKNTKICLDFWCECGAEGHYDGYFANNVHCPSCGGTFSLPYRLELGPPNEGAVATIRLDEESDQ